MTGLINSYKKVYENKKIHIWLFIIAFVWSFSSTMFDIKIGKPNTYKQNPFDILFNIFIGGYSLQFLHNAINNINSGVLPSFKEIQSKVFWGMIKLNIIWGVYACAALFFAVIIYMIALHTIIIPVGVIAVVAFLSVFVYYKFLAYAENLDSKGLGNISLIFKFVKPAFKQTYIKLITFILFSLAVAAVYILIYTAAGLTGLDKFGYIADEYYLMDTFMYAFATYFLIVTWFLAFPYSLINIYNKSVRPVLRKDSSDEQNA